MNKLLRIIVPVFIICFFGVCVRINAGRILQPVLLLPAAMPYDQVQAQCPLQIWVNQTKDWELAINSHDLTAFYLRDNQWYPVDARIKGTAGDGLGEFLNLLFAFKIPWLSPGGYTQPLTIKMPQGSGLVIYPQAEQLWLLALGNDQYNLVDPMGHYYELPANQWVEFAFSLEQVEIYWQTHRIWPEKSEPDQISGLAHEVNRDFSGNERLMWHQNSFIVSAGAAFHADLEVEAVPGLSHLELQFSAGLIPQLSNWTINDQPIVMYPKNNRYLVVIPDKSAVGSCTLSGTVLAGVSTQKQQSIIAVYGQDEVKLTGQVTRGWFGDQGQVIIHVTKNGKPVPNHAFKLFHGRTATTDANGCLTFTVKPGLHRIISCDAAGIVRWFSVGLNEIRRINIELDETKMSSGFIAWDFQLASEFNLGFSLYSPDLEIGFSTDEPFKLSAKTKTVTFDYQRDDKTSKWDLKYQPEKARQRISYGSCIWTKYGSQWQGLLNREGLILTADFVVDHRLPQLSGISIAKLNPYWKVGVQHKQFSLETRYKGFIIKLKAQEHKPVSFSLAPIGKSWTFSLNPTDLSINGVLFTSSNQYQWCYKYCFDGCSQVDLAYKNSQQETVFFIKKQSENASAGLKTAAVYGTASRELSVSFAGMYVKENLLAELMLHHRMSVSELYHLFVEWQGQYNNNVLTSSWGTGLIVGKNHMSAKVGWNQQSGSYFRLGVSLIDWF